MKIRQSIIQLESRIPLNPIRRQKSSRRTRDGVEISLGSWSVPAPSGTTVFTGKTNHTYEWQISATPLAWRGGRGSEKSSEHATPPTNQKRTGLTQGGRSSEVLGGLPGAQPPTLPLTRSQNVGAVTLSSLSVRIRKTGMSTASSSKVAESE